MPFQIGDIEGLLKDHKSRYTAPCRRNAQRLETIFEDLKAKFTSKVPMNAEQALEAASVYQKIIEAINQVKTFLGFCAFE